MRVYLVDDSQLVRHRLAAFLWKIPGIELVGEAENPSQALTGITRTKPDTLILDLELGGESGVDVLRQLRTRSARPAVIVFTNHATPEVAKKCLEAGALFFFDKTNDLDLLKNTLAELAKSPQPC
jgi:two-component system, NarL family, response regulator DevR